MHAHNEKYVLSPWVFVTNYAHNPANLKQILLLMNNIQLELKLNIVTEQLRTYLIVEICTPKISLITFSFERSKDFFNYI